MILYREGELIDCDEDSTIAKMFGMVGDTVAITFTRTDGDTVTWSKQPPQQCEECGGSNDRHFLNCSVWVKP